MRFGTKILLLTLLIAVGTSSTLAWVVTLNITRYETLRFDDRTSQAIAGYVSHLESEHRQIDTIVQELLEAPDARSQLQAADESASPAAREQLRQEILGRTVQTELESSEGSPAFHVLVNQAGEVLLTAAPGNAQLERDLSDSHLHWPIKPIIDSADEKVSFYLSLPSGLFLAMGVPLHAQLDDPPSHAYFVGFRVTDAWVSRQLLSQRSGATSTDAPLVAWFVTDRSIIASASSAPVDRNMNRFALDTPIRVNNHSLPPTSQSLGATESIEFQLAGEHYEGRRFELNPGGDSPGRLILASSLNQALLPLRQLQKQILMSSVITCLVAVVLCRWLARRLAQPVRELVAGTQKIAAGNFDRPVTLHRRDELGQLAVALNTMAGGLIERDTLRDQRTKTEFDLAVARKIQMDVLPKEIPRCPGYDIATYSLPAEQTGGDIFDVVPLNGHGDANSPLVLLLADATGHGIGAALSVTQVLAMLRIGVRLQAGLDNLLTQINRQLCQDLAADRFVTAFLGVLDPTLHTIRYHAAGQAPLLHFRARDGSLQWLNASMLPLGILDDPDDSAAEQIAMEPGDLFVLLTDGFYECHNTTGGQFGNERVAEVISAHHREPTGAILKHLLAATNAFAAGTAQADDMTAILIKRN